MIWITLAAGKGTRLGRASALTPKTLLQIHPKHVICDTHRQLARAIGSRKWVIVAGSQIAKIKTVVEKNNSIATEVVYNPFHTSPSPLFSVLRICHLALIDDLLIANGDTLYTKPFSTSLANHAHDGIYLYISRTSMSEGEMKIILDDKQRVLQAVTPHKTSPYVSSGLVLVKGHRQRLLFCLAVLQAIIKYLIGYPGYWHQIFNGVLSSTKNTSATIIGKQTWFEVDTPADLTKAKKYAQTHF